MYCGNCGTRLPGWAHFCEKCGARVHAAFGDDPIDRLEAENTLVEPIWDDEVSEREAEEPALGHADGVTVALDVAAELDPENMTVPMSMAGVVDDVGDASGDTEEPERPDGDVAEGNPEAEGEAADDGRPNEEALEQTQLMAEEELPASTREDAGDTSAQPEGEPEAQNLRADEPKAPATPPDGPERRPAQEGAPQTAGSVPQFLAANRVTAEQAGNRDMWDGADTVQGRYVLNPWEGRRRASERQRSRVPMALVAGVVCGAMVVTLSLGYRILFGGRAGGSQQEGSPAITSKVVSADEATQVIASLNGWWKTDRTYDGRYWHLTDGLMEVYAADGKIASQVLLDGSSIEHMSAGPGGIEGSGYYLRSIAFYLTDDDPDTLYAIDIDGTADEDANLLRSDVPPFMGGAQTETAPVSQPQEPADASEYILPESSTRVYEAWELEGLSDHDLFIARNEIYARHGYVFEGGELSEYFASKSWYLASDVFNEADITEIERQNVSLILSIEQQRGSSYV